MFFMVGHDVAIDNVFKDITWNKCKEDGTIVSGRYLSPFVRTAFCEDMLCED